MADGYGIGDATIRLDEAAVALADVRARMAEAIEVARYWRDEFDAHGFFGLGRGCEQIRGGAERIDGQATTLIRDIQAQAAAIAAITDAMKPDRIIATLTPVDHALQGVSAHCLAGTRSCDDQAALTARNLKGGKPEFLTDQADKAGRDFKQAQRHVNAAAAVVQNAMRLAREAGASTAQGQQYDAFTGMPAPVPEERPGAHIFDGIESGESEPDKDGSANTRRRRQLGGRLVDRAFKDADAVGDAVKTTAEDVEHGTAGSAPVPRAHTVPQIDVEPAHQQTVAAPDIVQAISLVGIATIKAIGLVMRHYEQRRKGHHGHTDN